MLKSSGRRARQREEEEEGGGVGKGSRRGRRSKGRLTKEGRLTSEREKKTREAEKKVSFNRSPARPFSPSHWSIVGWISFIHSIHSFNLVFILNSFKRSHSNSHDYDYWTFLPFFSPTVS
ncbi:hypothetical protein BDV41DRAFT_289819 [Aspergillus transmontanensis]|uniref:Uncharacterized protein n=1 Tax=Aspergillus transmontanensis TaxID=1034304 RepID=A0A5N6WH14_9EURO|nr:hypothetical protein BDV41DRAFT_289819 [Aspergillus transmontanensis]